MKIPLEPMLAPSDPFLTGMLVIMCLCLLFLFAVAFVATLQQKRPTQKKTPGWYLDAMREGITEIPWEVASIWEKIDARVKYMVRF